MDMACGEAKRIAKRTPKSLECLPTGESEHGEAEGDEQNDGDLRFGSSTLIRHLGYANIPMPHSASAHVRSHHWDLAGPTTV
jgi:hypothetical protein